LTPRKRLHFSASIFDIEIDEFLENFICWKNSKLSSLFTMDQTTFDLFQHTGYDNESAFASDPLSEKAWCPDDLVTFWESEKDIFPDIGSDSMRMLKTSKEESQSIKGPHNVSAASTRDLSPFSKNLTSGRSLLKGSYEDLKTLASKTDALASPLSLGTSCMMGYGSQFKKTALAASVADAQEAADDLFKNIPDFGIIGRKFSLAYDDDVSLEHLLDNYDDDGFGSVEALTPTAETEHMWDAADALWQEPSSINMETEDRILQLLARVKDMGAPMDELGDACNPTQTNQHSLTSNYSDSALNSSADDDDYDDNDLDVFDSLGDEPGESFWTDVKPINISPKSFETDDESEEVDIISVAEEVDSPKEEVIVMSSITDNLYPELSVKEQQALESLRRVTSDHCYCPLVILDWLEAAQKPVSIKCEKSSKKGALEHSDGLSRRSGIYKRLPLKRGRRKLSDSQGIPIGSRCKDSRRHGSRASRFFPHHSSREKREQLNQMERERRIGLKACF
jgi:hypothetical protein